MSDIFFISDLHLYHKNCLGFKRSDGVTPMRPPFQPTDPNDPAEVSRCLKLMNETMIENINSVVKPSSKLYNLGDCTFFHGKCFYDLYTSINTQQHRILFGNHDDPVKLLSMRIFKKAGIWRVFRSEDFTAGHIPFKRDSIKTNFMAHGHTHEKLVLNADGTPDLRYINVCVECTDYKPVHIDEISKIIKERKKLLGID